MSKVVKSVIFNCVTGILFFCIPVGVLLNDGVSKEKIFTEYVWQIIAVTLFTTCLFLICLTQLIRILGKRKGSIIVIGILFLIPHLEVMLLHKVFGILELVRSYKLVYGTRVLLPAVVLVALWRWLPKSWTESSNVKLPR